MATRSLLAARPSLPRIALEPHHVDIAGLAFIALGVFLGGVAYLGWSGGALGDGAVNAMRFAFGLSLVEIDPSKQYRRQRSSCTQGRLGGI